MFNMFPFNNNNNNNSNSNNNKLPYMNSFFNILDDGFLYSMVDQIMSSDLVNNLVNDMLQEEESYDVSMKDYGEYYLIKGYLPGFGPKDVSIDFEKNKAILTIKKKKKVYSNGQNMSMTIIQNGTSIVKNFYIGEVDVSKLKASFNNDILLLTIPKVKTIEDNYNESKRVEEPTIIDVNDYKIE